MKIGNPAEFQSRIYSGKLVPVRTSVGVTINTIGNLRKTGEDGDGNVGKTIKLITQEKKST